MRPSYRNSPPSPPDQPTRIRIDKWLWYARVATTRARCSQIARSGHVRLNGRRVKAPSQFVHVGDILTMALSSSVRVVQIAALGERRQSATLARQLYTTLRSTHSLTRTAGPDSTRAHAQAPAREPGSGRPTKQDRRRIIALRDR